MALTTVPASLSATALTLTTAAQPNITSVGTLTGLTVSGNIAGTLTTAAQTNITSVGTLTGLAATGNITVTKETPVITLTDSSASRTIQLIADDNNSVVRASGTLLLQAGGSTNALAFDASRNATFSEKVGIGTTAAPAAPLEIRGSANPLLILNQTNTSDHAALWFRHAGTTNGHIYVGDDNTMYLSTVTTNPALVIEPGGDVGIGTGATANYRLDLSDTIADQNPILYAAASGTPPDAFNWIAEFMAPNIAQDRRVTLALGKARSSNNSVTMSYVQRASTGNNALTFGHFGNNDLVSFCYSGNVGIGTTTPSAKLDIESSTNNAQLELTATDGTDQSFGIFGATGNNSNGVGLYFQDKTASGSPIRLKIDGSGNVGIGLTSGISSKLHVNTEMSLGPDGNNRGIINYSSNNLSLGTRQSSTNYFSTVNITGGQVGIGNTSPLQAHTQGITIGPRTILSDVVSYQTLLANNAYYKTGGVWKSIVATGGGYSAIRMYNGLFRIHTGTVSAADETLSNMDGTDIRLHIGSNGNVGIGTTSPSALLEVASSAPTFILNANTQATNKKKIRLAASQYSAGDFNIQQMNDDGTTIALTAMTIKNGGNVGIGTTNPLGLFTIRGTGDAIRVESTNAGTGGAQLDLLHHTGRPADGDTPGAVNFGGYYSGTSPAYSAAVRSIWTDVSAREGKLALLTREGSTFGERITVTHNGNIGMGTSLPSQKLHTYNLSAENWMFENGTSGSTGKIYLKTRDNADLSKYLMMNAYWTEIGVHNNEGFRVRNTTSNGVINFYVTGLAGNYYFMGSQQSDLNLKENIEDISINATDFIKAAKPKKFKYKQAPDIEKAGFIAQEMKELVPGLVTGEDYDEEVASSGLGFDYMGYTAYLTKALQESIARIEALEAEVKALKGE